jgi:hypothetical protein
MSQAPLLTGVLAPVITPFKPDLSPDVERYVRHCKWLLANGCSGLAIFGTNSEANSLSLDERKMLLEALLEAGVPASKLMPGTGCCSLTDSVSLTRFAVERGVAGALMLPPFFYKGVSDEGLYRNFAEIAQRVGDGQRHGERDALRHGQRVAVGQCARDGVGPRRRNVVTHRARSHIYVPKLARSYRSVISLDPQSPRLQTTGEIRQRSCVY